MIPEIEQLILKRRRVIYGDLKKKKEIQPEGYFIVRVDDKVSELIIPGVEKFITTPRMKDMLADYIDFKWREYSAKMPMELVAVVMMADMKFKKEKYEKGESREGVLKKPRLSPCEDPTSTEVIGFSVSTLTEQGLYGYPYYRIGKKLTFGAPEEYLYDMEVEGRLANLFPKHLIH